MDYQIPVVTQQNAGGMGRHLCADHRSEQSRSSCLRYLPASRGASDDDCRGRGNADQREVEEAAFADHSDHCQFDRLDVRILGRSHTRSTASSHLSHGPPKPSSSRLPHRRAPRSLLGSLLHDENLSGESSTRSIRKCRQKVISDHRRGLPGSTRRFLGRR